jgi:outer membrane protein TolC
MSINWIACPLFIGVALACGAQTTNSTRSISLDECIQMALEHNLDVAIKSKTPEIDLYNLDSNYGAYDPAFKLIQSQSFGSFPGSIDPRTGLKSPDIANLQEIYSPTISGVLPTGFNYSVGSVNSPLLIRKSGSSFAATGPQYQTSAGISVTQPLLKNSWTDITRQTIGVNKLQVKIDQLALQFQVMNTVSAVENAYYELVYDYEAIKVQQKALELAEKLLVENKKRVEVGALAPLDEKQAESQSATAKAGLVTAFQTLGTAQRTLKSLMTADFTTLADVELQPTETLVAVPEQMDRQESWKSAVNLRPDLALMRESIEQQNIVLRYSYNQLFPQLDLGATYGHNGLGSSLEGGFNGIEQGRNQFYSYQITLSIPFSNIGAKNTYKAGKAKKEQLILQMKQAEQNILVQVDNAIGTVKGTFEKVGATREARIFAEAALEAEQKKLENGKSTSFTVLSLQNTLTTARGAEIRALADYMEAVAQYIFSEGLTLDRHKLNVQIH